MEHPTGPESLDAVTALAYRELRAIAHARLMARGPQGTLSTTALVHEAYLKLADHAQAGWNDRAHFLAVASVAMRHVLVDRARERATLKRGGERQRVTLDEVELSVDTESDVAPARRRAQSPRYVRLAPREGRRMPVLRRPHRTGNRRRTRHYDSHGASRLGEGAGAAATRARRLTIRSAVVSDALAGAAGRPLPRSSTSCSTPRRRSERRSSSG